MTSLVGHIISYTFCGMVHHHPIIAQYQHGYKTRYVIPSWNGKRFDYLSSTDYQLDPERCTISKEAFPLSEPHKAMSRAYRLQQLLIKHAARVTRARTNAAYVSVPEVQAAYRSHKDMLDRLDFQSYPQAMEWVDSSEGYLGQVLALHKTLDKLFRDEMKLAGIEL